MAKANNAVCEQCGIAFHVKPSALSHTHYCSKACHDEAQSRKVTRICATCGKIVMVPPSRDKAWQNIFCGNECRLAWLSDRIKQEVNVPGHSKGHKAPHLSEYNSGCNTRKLSARHKAPHLSKYNRAQNPKNTSAGWTWEQREAVRAREQKNKGPCARDTYPKYHGRHEHRVVAEQMLGRPLLPGEVVHHIDFNRHNNDPSNLMVFASQAEHTQYHRQLDRAKKEVMLNETSDK